jgi:hypothetical protein
MASRHDAEVVLETAASPAVALRTPPAAALGLASKWSRAEVFVPLEPTEGAALPVEGPGHLLAELRLRRVPETTDDFVVVGVLCVDQRPGFAWRWLWHDAIIG